LKFKRVKNLLVVGFILVGLVGCGNNSTTKSKGDIVVDSTTAQIEESSQEVASAVEENTTAIVTPTVEEDNRMAVVTPTPTPVVEEPYIKRDTEVKRVESEPETLAEHALVASGDITVKKTLTTDGPLGDVVSFGKLNAEPRSLNISGKISSSNDLGNAIIRSFDYKSDKENSTFSQIRALKVGEYLNTALLDEYYLLSSDGKALHIVKDQNDTNLTLENITFTFKNNSWTISGDKAEIDLPIKVESSLDINSTSLFVKGTLMVEGDLNASGELNINTGTPFNKALIVDNSIEVDKLVMIGRLHGSGDFIANGQLNIMGNAEIDGDVTLYGDAKINFLDNIYKAALYEAQEDAKEKNTTMTLVHSQLFSNVKGRNSVVLFTFVEGDYLINENTLFDLIENNQTNKFNFKSYLYGATIDYGAELQKFDGLSPYYANKLALLKKFKDEGYNGIKIKESIDIAPSNLYHTFADKDNEEIGTYLVYSFANPFDINNTITLTQDQRDQAIYAIEHKKEIEAQYIQDAQNEMENQKQDIVDDNETNESVKSEIISEIEAEDANLSTIDKNATDVEATEDRVHEWVEYKELEDNLVEFNATVVDVDYAKELPLVIDNNISDDNISDINGTIVVDNNDTNESVSEKIEARGWFRRARRRLRHTFRRITFTDCKKKYSSGYILGVKGNNRWDVWSRDISIVNNLLQR